MNTKEYQIYYRDKNREAIKQQRREYYAKNRERIQQLKKDIYDPLKQKNTRLLKEYGITLEKYNSLLLEQNGQCACCGVSVSELTTCNNQFGGKALVVDHCHTKGTVRTLLCSRCNTVVGMVEENVEILDKLKKYVKKWNRKQE